MPSIRGSESKLSPASVTGEEGKAGLLLQLCGRGMQALTTIAGYGNPKVQMDRALTLSSTKAKRAALKEATILTPNEPPGF